MIPCELNYFKLWSSSSLKSYLSDLLSKTHQVGSMLSVAVTEVTRFNSQNGGKLIV